MNQIYSTSSLHDAAWLLTVSPKRYRGMTFDGQQCKMHFDNEDGLVLASLASYRDGATCSARDFADSVNFLKVRIKETGAQQHRIRRIAAANAAAAAQLQPA